MTNPETGHTGEVVQPPLDRHSDMLRLATAGSVDDGKSTLIGRLLFDSKAIFEDQLAAVVAEIAATQITERGETRADDRVTEAAMEDRKRQGYF